MTANERLRARGQRRARRILADLAIEFRDARVRAGVSQVELGRRLAMSGDKIWQIEHERLPSLSLRDACELAAVLGFDLTARLYPNGAPIRDAGQARRLNTLLASVTAPLSFRTDVALPALDDRPELRAWDAVVYGHAMRTGIELEVRLADVQAMTRRHNLKRRDDPVDQFLLAVAETRHNRRVLAEYGDLLAGLPRLRASAVMKLLRAGCHPPTGRILV